MRPLERQRKIASLVASQGDLTVDEACRLLEISQATARRDFVELAARGEAQKAWGGLKRLDAGPVASMVPSGVRNLLHVSEKEAIAREACRLVQDGDVLIIDGGTTTLQMAPHLADRPVRILTNSLLIAHRIDNFRSVPEGAEVFLTGGFLYPGSGLLVGPEAIESLSRYHARWAFLSAGGFDSAGTTNTNQLVVEGERAMIRMAQSVVVLADHSKWQRREMAQACRWEEVERLITDRAIPGLEISPGKVVIAEP